MPTKITQRLSQASARRPAPGRAPEILSRKKVLDAALQICRGDDALVDPFMKMDSLAPLFRLGAQAQLLDLAQALQDRCLQKISILETYRPQLRGDLAGNDLLDKFENLLAKENSYDTFSCTYPQKRYHLSTEKDKIKMLLALMAELYARNTIAAHYKDKFDPGGKKQAVLLVAFHKYGPNTPLAKIPTSVDRIFAGHANDVGLPFDYPRAWFILPFRNKSCLATYFPVEEHGHSFGQIRSFKQQTCASARAEEMPASIIQMHPKCYLNLLLLAESVLDLIPLMIKLDAPLLRKTLDDPTQSPDKIAAAARALEGLL
jgi:hypothetical protein